MSRPNSDTNGTRPTIGACARTFTSFREIADLLWQNAERMRGAYKPNKYDEVILPLLVLRRLDCVLAPTKEKVLGRSLERTCYPLGSGGSWRSSAER